MARQKAAFGVLLGSQEPVGTAMLLPTQLLGRTVEKKKKKRISLAAGMERANFRTYKLLSPQQKR